MSNTSLKVFSDPVHGHISLNPACMAIVDTPEFQRLRNIKQLGGGYFVYPGASHNKFEHSLGVCHLAGKLVRALREGQPELIDEKDVLCVEIAGLCHDLGSAPISHVFWTKFIPQAREDHIQWKHEKASLGLFNQMINNHGLRQKLLKDGDLEENDLNFIRNLICPPSGDAQREYEGRRGDTKNFLYEIVTNKKNGMDVDKWDYLLRDCLHLGMGSNFNYDRYICFARLVHVGGKWQICMPEKEQFSVFHLFQTHHSLSKKAYGHRVVNAVENMFVEALTLADQVPLIPGERGELLTVSQCIGDMTAYTNLTDNIFYQIRISTDVRLKKSRDLLRALDQRKIFKCVGESRPIAKGTLDILDSDCQVFEKEREIMDELRRRFPQTQLGIPENCIQVQVVTLDFVEGGMNPLNDLHFYTKRDPTKAQLADSEEVSHLFPKEFQEQIVRVYLKHDWDSSGQFVTDHQKNDVVYVGTAFKNWCDVKLGKPPKLFYQDWQFPTREGGM